MVCNGFNIDQFNVCDEIPLSIIDKFQRICNLSHNMKPGYDIPELKLNNSPTILSMLQNGREHKTPDGKNFIPFPKPMQSALRNFISTMNDEGDTEPPNRFIVNEHNRREIEFIVLPQIESNSHIENTDLSADTDISIINPKYINSTDINKIKQISDYIKYLIASTSITPPKFYAGNFHKIKNFIHNITRIWLKHSELHIFIIQMTMNHKLRVC
jgi:hypothetical protein